jgi:hypothetical protein
MKKYIVSALLILGSSISSYSMAVSLDVSDYQFATSATSVDPFGVSGANSFASAMTDQSLSSFVYVPSASTQPTMNMSLGFDSAVTNDLTFFFVGGGTGNALDLTIGDTTKSYSSSSILYTDASEAFAFTAVTNIGEFTLSAIFVDLDEYGVSSLTNLDIGLGKGSYLAMVAANPATVSAVPLPAAAWLFITGLMSLGFVSRRKA